MTMFKQIREHTNMPQEYKKKEMSDTKDLIQDTEK